MRDIEKIFEDVVKERKYQTRKWGTYNDSLLSTSDWILAIERQLQIAKEALMNDLIKRTGGYGSVSYDGHVDAPRRIMKIAATCVAGLQHILGREDETAEARRSKKRPRARKGQVRNKAKN